MYSVKHDESQKITDRSEYLAVLIEVWGLEVGWRRFCHKSENRCAHRERNGKQGDSKRGVLPNGRHLEVCNPEEIRFQGGHESCLQIFDTGEG